ncbi:MAG: hypothetical protein IJ518_00835 [Clostridia bacterium]|nr:hypothetical protein [Clostridia bacterium]
MAAVEPFFIPGIQFFISGNPFSGSYKGLNYRVVPVKANVEKDIDSHLEVAVWYGMLCSDLSEMAAREQFPLDVDGLEQTKGWLQQQYERMVTENI